MYMSDKKVLLTGASGFIGKHTIPFLLSHNYEVHAVARSIRDLPDNIYKHQVDLLDPNQTTQLIKKVNPSYLLHFAWDATPFKFWTSELNLDWVCASIHLLKQFTAIGGKRVVIAGTCAEYDWSYGLCKENSTPLTSSTLYGTCKASLFKIVDSYARQVGLSTAWGRIFYLFGPHEQPEKLVPIITQSLLRKEIAKCSHGMQVRDFLHVDDVASAFVSLLNSQIQGPVNIASGQAVTLKEIINYIASNLDAKDLVRFGAIAPKSSDAPVVLPETTRLFTELNWRPKYSLEEGLNNTIDWWKLQQKVTH